MEPYRTIFPDPSAALPRTEEVAQRVVVLPTGLQVTADDVERVVEVIRFVAKHAPSIASRLEAVPAQSSAGPEAAPKR